MTEGDPVSLSDRTSVGMPIRNLIGLIGTVCVGAWGYFGILERLNVVETNQVLMQADLTKNTEFRIKWPRGEMGSLPADAEQFLLIEDAIKDIEQIEEELKESRHNATNIKRLQSGLFIHKSSHSSNVFPCSVDILSCSLHSF